MVTIKEVSQTAGVSSATVSRVINNPESVKEKTREKVLNAIDSLGYRHNSIAASLASKQTNTVGYVVPELHGFFFGSLMSGTEAVLRSANKHMFVATGHSNERMEKEAIEDLMGRRCDALILHVEAISDEYLIEFAKTSIPFVVVNRFIPEIGERCIALDNKLGGYQATQLLISQGHKNIAYIAGSLWKADGRDRLNGHIKALQENGLEYDPRLVYEGDFQAHAGKEGVEKLLSSGMEFSAVVCANDEMASGAIEGLREHNIDVPRQVSVVGFDDVEFSRYLFPKLTTIEYPTTKIGETAAKWVLSSVYAKENIEFEHVIAPKLVMRDSTTRL